MAYQPVNGALLYQVFNVENWVRQGSAFYVGGSFTTVSGKPSQQLLASTNTIMGYYNGQMLANAAGGGTGIYAGLTAGALVNFDPLSTDTGQAVWNGYVITDPSIKFPLPINTTYPGTLLVATPLQGWVLRQQFMYAGGTPAADIAAVETAVLGFTKPAVIQSQTMNSSNSYEIIFAY